MAVAWYWYEIHSEAPTTQFDPSDTGQTNFGAYEAGGSARRDFKYGENRLELTGGRPGYERRLVFHRSLTIGPAGNIFTIPLARANGQAHGQFNLVARGLSTPLDDTSVGTLGAYTWNTTPGPGALITPSLRTFRRLPQVLYSEDPFFSYAIDVAGLADWMLLLEGYEAFDSRTQFTSAHTIYTGDGTITFT
jgi:hypothetical protein